MGTDLAKDSFAHLGLATELPAPNPFSAHFLFLIDLRSENFAERCQLTYWCFKGNRE